MFAENVHAASIRFKSISDRLRSNENSAWSIRVKCRFKHNTCWADRSDQAVHTCRLVDTIFLPVCYREYYVSKSK